MKTVAIDRQHDLALLKISGPPIAAMKLGDSEQVREGEIFAFTGFPIGNLLGFVPVTHRGMVASLTPIAQPSATAQQLNEKVIKRIQSGAFRVFQLDATAYPGNSGSPTIRIGGGGELRAHHEQIPLEHDHDLVELRAPIDLGAGETQRGDGFVDRAVRVGPGGVLAHAAAVQQAGGAVVALAGVDLRCHVRRSLRRVARVTTRVRLAWRPMPAANDPAAESTPAEPPASHSVNASANPSPSGRPSALRAAFKTARPKQWTKNVLVFAAPAAAGVLDQRQAARDRRRVRRVLPRGQRHLLPQRREPRRSHRLHPTKRHRPIAAGHLAPVPRIIAGVLIVLVLLVTAPVNDGKLAAVVAGIPC